MPDYLRGVFGADELSAQELATEIDRAVAVAEELLAELREPAGREAWQRRAFPELAGRREATEQQRRALVQGPHDGATVRALSEQVKQWDRELLGRLTEAVVQALHIRNLPYYDSRGALLPWSIALGGEAFYERLLAQAEIRAETADDL